MDIREDNFNYVALIFRRLEAARIRSMKAVNTEEQSQKALDDMKRRGIQSDGDIIFAAEQVNRKRRAKARFHAAEEQASNIFKALTAPLAELEQEFGV